MIRYPIIVQDDFFEDPDAIVELANSVDYHDGSSAWPGKRTDHLQEVNQRFFDYFTGKVFSAFGLVPSGAQMEATFQKIIPFSKDKWDIKNRGWVHVDAANSVVFGGIVYLNKNADKDTGTSIYRPKEGFYYDHPEERKMKRKLYAGEDVTDEEYAEKYNSYNDQFEETIKVDNIYNRFFAFPNTAWHGVRTYGTEERLTIPFFCRRVDYHEPKESN
jgi:hypothetical protein